MELRKADRKKVRIELEWQIKVYCDKISKFETTSNWIEARVHQNKFVRYLMTFIGIEHVLHFTVLKSDQTKQRSEHTHKHKHKNEMISILLDIYVSFVRVIKYREKSEWEKKISNRLNLSAEDKNHPRFSLFTQSVLFVFICFIAVYPICIHKCRKYLLSLAYFRFGLNIICHPVEEYGSSWGTCVTR